MSPVCWTFWLWIHLLLNASLAWSSGNSTLNCLISGKKIQVGESYFQVIPTNADTFCVACVCPITGKSSCESRSCDKDLDEICKSGSSKIDTECCQRCSEHRKVKESSNSQNDTKQVSCIHNGRLYNDGQAFPSHTDSRSRQPNQCVQCVCKLGVVLCRLKTCIVDHCPLNVTKPGADEDCCISQVSCKDQFKARPVDSLQPSELFIGDQDTKEDDSIEEFPPSIVFVSQEKPSSNSKRKSRCKSGGRFFPNGATWNPILGPFGVMDCVTCKCVENKIECSRMKCPPPERLGCPQPKRVAGQCCPSCPSSQPLPTNTICSEQSPLNLQVYRYTQLISQAGATSYQYAFVENGTTKDVFIYSWSFRKGRFENLSGQHIEKQQFTALQQRFNFELIGATRQKYKERFVKKASRLSQRCKNNCEQKISSLERALKLKDIT